MSLVGNGNRPVKVRRMLRPASKNRCGSRAYGSSARFALATDRRGFLPEDGDFEGWIGAAESGGNPKINHFDNASIRFRTMLPGYIFR